MFNTNPTRKRIIPKESLLRGVKEFCMAEKIRPDRAGFRDPVVYPRG
jgi:hypothetical protein